MQTIRPDIGFCRFEGCTIILDTAADRYFRTSEAIGLALETMQRGQDIAPTMRARLQAFGLLTAIPEGCRTGFPPERVSAGAVDEIDRDVRIGLRTAAAVFAAQFWALRLLATRPLAIALARVAALQRAAPRRRPQQSIQHQAQIFHRCRALLPWKPLCLADTIAFVRFATRRGHRPQLVIGVEAYPFAAHCWAQLDDIVLNDAYDHATRFRPIFAL